MVEEQLFTLTVHRDRALNYKSEEVQLTAVDEIYVEQDMKGVVHRMIARVRIFFLGFLSGLSPEFTDIYYGLKKCQHSFYFWNEFHYQGLGKSNFLVYSSLLD